MSLLGNYAPVEGFHPIGAIGGAISGMAIDGVGHVAPNNDGPIIELLKGYIERPENQKILGYVLNVMYGNFSGQHITVNTVKIGPYYSRPAASGAPFSELKLLRQKSVATVQLTGSSFRYDAWDLRSAYGQQQYGAFSGRMAGSLLMAVTAGAVRDLYAVARGYVMAFVLPYCMGRDPTKVFTDLLKFRIDCWGSCAFPEGLRNVIEQGNMRVSDQEGSTDTIVAPPNVVNLGGAIHATELRSSLAGPGAVATRERGLSTVTTILDKTVVVANNAAKFLPGYGPSNELIGCSEIGERYFVSGEESGRYRSSSMSVSLFDDTRGRFVPVELKEMVEHSGRYAADGSPQSPSTKGINSQYEDPFEYDVNGGKHVNSFVGTFKLEGGFFKTLVRSITDSFEAATSYPRGEIVYTLSVLLDQVISALEQAPVTVEFFEVLREVNESNTSGYIPNNYGSLNLPENRYSNPTVPPGYANANGLLYLASQVSSGEWDVKDYDKVLGLNIVKVVGALRSLVSYLRGISHDNPLFSEKLISDILPRKTLSDEDSAFVAFVQNAILQTHAFPIYLLPGKEAEVEDQPNNEGDVEDLGGEDEDLFAQFGAQMKRKQFNIRKDLGDNRDLFNKVDVEGILKTQFARYIATGKDIIQEPGDLVAWCAANNWGVNTPSDALNHLKWLLVFTISVSNFKTQFAKRQQMVTSLSLNLWEAFGEQAARNAECNVEEVIQRMNTFNFASSDKAKAASTEKIKTTLIAKLKASLTREFNAAERIFDKSNTAKKDDIVVTKGVENMLRTPLTWSRNFSEKLSKLVVSDGVTEFGDAFPMTQSTVESPFVPADINTLKLYNAKPEIARMTADEHRNSHPYSRIGTSMMSRAAVGNADNLKLHTSQGRTSAGVVPGVAAAKANKSNGGSVNSSQMRRPTQPQRIGVPYNSHARVQTIQDLMNLKNKDSRTKHHHARDTSFGESVSVMDRAFSDASGELLDATESTRFEESLYFISKLGRGFNRAVALFYVFCRNTLETIQNFIEADIQLPFEIMLVRPWMCYEVGNAFLVLSGGRTATAYMEIPQSYGGIDPNTRTVNTSHGTKFAISVSDATNLLDLPSVHVMSAKYGCNTTFFEPFSGKDIRQLKREGHSIISIIVPKGYSRKPDSPDFFDITGSLHLVDEKNEVQPFGATHYPGIDFVRRAFEVDAVRLSRNLPMEGSENALGPRTYEQNTVCFDGVYIPASVAGDGSVSYPYSTAQLGTGYWKKFGASADLGELRFGKPTKIGGKY